jgi:hypothetical protein
MRVCPENRVFFEVPIQGRMEISTEILQECGQDEIVKLVNQGMRLFIESTEDGGIELCVMF